MNERRHDLDWLRIIAFGLLIFYHVGMFYVSWDWHVKSSRASDAIEPLMRLTNPWRLTLLFLIAGAATRFIADKMNRKELAASRLRRLFPPLLLAIFVIVPPQSYFEVVEAARAMGTPVGSPQSTWLDNFYLKYITASGGWCDQDGCLITPTYNHMWFVAYLILYTLALVPLVSWLRRIPPLTPRIANGAALIVLPWLWMFGLRATLLPVFGETHFFVNDWYLHALYFSMFLLGFVIAKQQAFFDACMSVRWVALTLAIVSWLAVMILLGRDWGFESGPPQWLWVIGRGIRELQAWTAIVALIGFAHRYLKHADGPVKRVLTQAIFPFYLIHQTIIVVAGHYLDPMQWPLLIEALVLIAITALGCWGFYVLGRSVPMLRTWVGLTEQAARPDRALARA